MRALAVAIAAIAIAAVLAGCSSGPSPRSAPFVHVVLFKTRAADREAASAELVRDVREMLAPLPTVKGLWIGSPAPTATRPIVDANYDVGILLLFEDQEGLQEYLDHPTHVEFAKKHDTQADVRVFDFTSKK